MGSIRNFDLPTWEQQIPFVTSWEELVDDAFGVADISSLVYYAIKYG